MVLCIQFVLHLVSGIMSMWPKQRELWALLEEISSITHFCCINCKQLLYNDMCMLEKWKNYSFIFYNIFLCVPVKLFDVLWKWQKDCHFLIVSQNELRRYSLWNTPMATCSASILQIRKCLRSGTFVGYGLINDYSGPSDWPTITRSCFEMWCFCSFILQCFCTSFKGPEHVETMWQCFSPRAGLPAH